MMDGTVTVEGVVLTKESIEAIKYFQDPSSSDQGVFDEIIDALLEYDPVDDNFKNRLQLIQEVRFLNKKLKSLNAAKEMMKGDTI